MTRRNLTAHAHCFSVGLIRCESFPKFFFSLPSGTEFSVCQWSRQNRLRQHKTEHDDGLFSAWHFPVFTIVSEVSGFKRLEVSQILFVGLEHFIGHFANFT